MSDTIEYNILSGISDLKYNPQDDTDYLYIGGARRAITNRRVRKNKKVDSRIANRAGRVAAKQTSADAKLSGSKGDTEMAKALAPTGKKSNMGLYIGLGVGVLVLAGVAFYFLKGKKIGK